MITDAMIDAGFAVLCDSGIADEYPQWHRLVIEKIYRMMHEARPPIRTVTLRRKDSTESKIPYTGILKTITPEVSNGHTYEITSFRLSPNIQGG